MPDMDDTFNLLKRSYPMSIDRMEFNRDGGSLSYIVYADGGKYFLRVIRPALMDTALQSIDIHLYLSDNGFTVPSIIRTKDNAAYVKTGEKEDTYLYVMYPFIDGKEPESADAEQVGRLVGQFHRLMRDYTGNLAYRDQAFFIGRYVNILRKKNYKRAEAFGALGDTLWERVKNLPRGFCHGDLYRGNVHKTSDGALYILDFDTACSAFPVYDAVLFCNETDYFDYKEDGLRRTKETFSKFLAGYSSINTFSGDEIAAFGDLMAVYHFQVQATILEIYGPDCVDELFLDKQLDWIERWLNQCQGVSWG